MDAANLSQQLQGLPGLSMTLAEDETQKFQISPAGQLSVFRANRWNSSKTPLDPQAVHALAHKIATQPASALLGPWFFRVLPGGKGWTIFGERCPQVPEEKIAAVVEEELLAQARAGSTGVIAGGLGSNKASMLLWLASLLGRRELVFISELPPIEPLEPTLTHVYPPSNERQRRDLERLLRAHDCIFWEGIRHPADFVSLLSAPATHNRWFSVDAGTPRDLTGRLHSLIAPLGSLVLDSCMFIEVDAETGASIASLSRHGAEGWTELLDDAAPVVEALDELSCLDASPSRPSRRGTSKPDASKPAANQQAPDKREAGAPDAAPPSAPSDPSSSDYTSADVPQADEAPSQAAVITPQRAGRTGRFSRVKRSTAKSSARNENSADNSPPTAPSPPEEPTVDSKIEPLSGSNIEALADEDSDPTLGSGVRRPRDLGGMSLDELLKSDEIEREELLRHSGEIDLQSMLRARKARQREQAEFVVDSGAEANAEHIEPAAASSADDSSLPSVESPSESGLRYESDHAATNIADGAKVDEILAKMGKSSGTGASDLFSDVSPDELTPPVRDETTALTPVDLERIRDSADDELSWLLGDEDDEGDAEEDDTMRDRPSPVSDGTTDAERGTDPAKPIWEADPAPTNELSADDRRRETSDTEE